MLWLLLFLFRTAVARTDSLFGSSRGRFHEQSENSELFQPAHQALSCPASNCDGSGTLQHHFNDQSTGSSVACLKDGFDFTLDNGFLRCFSGSLCSTERTVETVYFRTNLLQGASLVVTVNLFKGGTSNGCDNPANVAALYRQQPVTTRTVALSPGFDFPTTVPIEQGIKFLPTESLLIEIKAPTMDGFGQFFVADSNDPAQCDPSYVQTTSCGSTTDPVTTASLDFAGVSFVISVNTKLAAPSNAPSPLITPTSPAPQAPAGRPVPAPPEFCLSGCGLVVVEGVGKVPVNQVKIGDYLQTGNGKYSRVFSLAHHHPDIETTFIQIYTGDDEPLEMTGHHLVFVNGTAVRASYVCVGDLLGRQVVTKLTEVKRRGVYAPLTESGDFVVNGIQVSSYVGILDDAGAVWNQHVLGHLLFSPVRVLCRFRPQCCLAEEHDEAGFSNLYNWLIWLIVWVGRWGKTVSFLVSATAVPVLVAFWVIEQILRDTVAFAAFVTFGTTLFVATRPTNVNSIRRSMLAN